MECVLKETINPGSLPRRKDMMIRIRFFSILAVLWLVTGPTLGEESPEFWTNQGGLVRQLTLAGGLSAPLTNVDLSTGIEIRDPNHAVFPYADFPIPSFPGGNAEIYQLNLTTLELELLTRNGPVTGFDPSFNTQGHLVSIGTGDFFSEEAILEWDLSQQTYTSTPIDIRPEYLVGLASFGGFLYGVAAPAPYSFMEIDPGTGVVTVLSDAFVPSGSTFVGMDFDYDGILWVAHQGTAHLELGRITNLNNLTIESMGSYPATDPFHGFSIMPRGDVIAIPTLGPLGILILVLLMTGLGVAVLRSPR